MTAVLVVLAAALAEEPTPRLAATAAPFPDDACGALTALPQDPVPSPMLADRLRLTLPQGTARSDLPNNVMSASVADQSGSLYFVEDGQDRMGVVANETFQLAGQDFAGAARAYLADLPPEGAPWNLAPLPVASDSVQAMAYWPGQLIVDGDADVWALGVLYALPDGGVAHVSFRLDTATASHGLGCTGYALKLAATAVPGDRQLTRAPHEETLAATAAQSLHLTLPADMVVLPQPGPDFQVYYVLPLTALGAASPSLGVYVGPYPQDLEPTNLPDVKGRLLGKKGAWSASEALAPDGSGVALRLERRLEIKAKKDETPLYVHVFIAANSQPELDALRLVAEGMRWEKVAQGD